MIFTVRCCLASLKQIQLNNEATNVCLCACMCVRVFVCVCVCVLDVMRKMLNEVLQCVYVISRVHYALGCVYTCVCILYVIVFVVCTSRSK